MLTENEIGQIRQELENCKRPIFFFDDDPDGLAGFLLLYRFKGEGKGFVLKAAPRLTEAHAEKVKEYGADKAFVLDIAMIDQEFVDKAKIPVIWIDHHQLLQRDKVKYYNPRAKANKSIPTSYLCYAVVKQDLWIAMTGAIADWHFPDFAEEFKENYPGIIPKGIDNVEEALFNSKIGLLVRIFSFNLKGKTSEVMKSIRVLTRIKSPYEILNKETPAGKFIYQRYSKINDDYEKLLKEALKKESKGDVFVFTYKEDKISLTKDLANELLYRLKHKIIIAGREKSGEVRCSLRSRKGINMLELLQKALVGIEGYGGGHENACGASIKKEDFERFVENVRRRLSHGA